MITLSVIHPTSLGLITAEPSFDLTIDESKLHDLFTKAKWSPIVFKDKRRKADNFLHTDMLVLDVDDGCTLEEALKLFKEYKHVIYTTRNHQKEKNGIIADRFRVVLFTSRRIESRDEYLATWDSIYKAYPFIDSACRDAARMFYAGLNVVSSSLTGLTIPPSIPLAAPAVPAVKSAVEGVKGELYKSTLDFLVNGAPAGSRHVALVKACSNMREQGYSLDEAMAAVDGMTRGLFSDWGQEGLNKKDVATINDVFSRPDRFEFKEKEAVLAAFVRGDALLGEMVEYIRNKDLMTGTPTGIAGLDEMFGGGFRAGELNVLAAQAKTGKSSLFHYMIWSLLKNGVKVGYGSRELSPATEVLPNLLSIEKKMNFYKLDGVSERIEADSKEILGKWPLYFAPGYGHWSPTQIEEWVKAMVEEGVQILFLDHLHHFVLSEDHNEIANLIKKIKTITKQYNVCINLVVQPRTLREGERVNINTVRGGAVVNQALDNLLIFERVKGENNISKLTLEIARHKLCNPGHIFLQYDKEAMSFEEVEKESVNDGSTLEEKFRPDFNKHGGRQQQVMKHWPKYDG